MPQLEPAHLLALQSSQETQAAEVNELITPTAEEMNQDGHGDCRQADEECGIQESHAPWSPLALGIFFSTSATKRCPAVMCPS